MSTSRSVLILSLLTILTITCGSLTTASPPSAKATMDVGLVVQATLRAVTEQAGPISEPSLPPAPPAPIVTTGGIAGQLMYPASGLPSLRIVAFQLGGGAYYYIDTALGQSSYELHNVPPGTYHVVAYPLPGGGFTGGPAGGYSQMVPCGLQYGCNDHTLIDVVVTAGNVTAGADPNDYYAEPGGFPPNPVP